MDLAIQLTWGLEELGDRLGIRDAALQVSDSGVPGMAVDADGDEVQLGLGQRTIEGNGVRHRVAFTGAISSGGTDLKTILPGDQRHEKAIMKGLSLSPDLDSLV